MIKVDIFSGFLGAGKTTLIKKLIKEGYAGEKLVLIENEFGQIGIDGGFLREAGIEITEMNSGCICCSLVGDFGEALGKVASEFAPDRIIIEPSGVGKLSDVIKAVKSSGVDGLELGSLITVIDASKCKIYLKNFSEFYENQIEHAGAIIFSRTDSLSQEKLDVAVSLVRGINDEAVLITTPWDQLDGKAIRAAIEKPHTVKDELDEMIKAHEHNHKHHHHGHDEDCCCGHDHGHHHHDHDEDCCCGHDHEHHHHGHDEECCCGHDHEHHHHGHDEECCCGHDHEHHHHDHDEDCCCGHDHEHHHHHDGECSDPNCSCHDHHADEVFTSWGCETSRKFDEEFISSCLDALDTCDYGTVLRAKGIVQGKDGGWLFFDYVPGEKNIRKGEADIIGKLCVIGSGLDEKALKELFNC